MAITNRNTIFITSPRLGGYPTTLEMPRIARSSENALVASQHTAATKRAFTVPPSWQNSEARWRQTRLISILVEDYSINQHVVTCPDVMDADWSPYFNPCPYRILI